MHDAKAIRITQADHERLARLVRLTSMPQHEVIHRALDMFEREALLDSINDGFEALQGDPAAWRAELAERAAWELSYPDARTEG